MPQADRTPRRVNRDSELSDLATGQSPRTWPDELDALSPLEVLRIAGKAGAEVVARLVTEPVAGPAGIARAAFPARCGVSARASGRPADRPRRLSSEPTPQPWARSNATASGRRAPGNVVSASGEGYRIERPKLIPEIRPPWLVRQYGSGSRRLAGVRLEPRFGCPNPRKPVTRPATHRKEVPRAAGARTQ